LYIALEISYCTISSRLIDTLFIEVPLSWFSPILEKNSPILADFDTFWIEFNNTFGDTNRVRIATTKFRSLQQKSCTVSTYPTEFQLLVNNVDWNDNVLISAF